MRYSWRIIVLVAIAVSANLTIMANIDITLKSEMTDTDEWYTLQGVRLEGKPTHHGMYIHNGRVHSITSSQP